jgi:hypothetical protein
VKFSLAEGVFGNLQMLINPGELPNGTAANASEHSQATHALPLPPRAIGETDYSKIFEKMMDFVGVDVGKKVYSYPIIFTKSGSMNEDIKAAKMTIDKICEEAGHNNLSLRVYPIEQLFYRLHKKCVQDSNETAFSSIALATDSLYRNKFEERDIGCDFHKKKDRNPHCSLSKVKAWSYNIAMFCLKENDLKIPGRHTPDDEAPITVEWSWDDDLSNSFKPLKIRNSLTLTSNFPSVESLAPSSAAESISQSIESQKSVPEESATLSSRILARSAGKRGGKAAKRT